MTTYTVPDSPADPEAAALQLRALTAAARILQVGK